MKDTFQIMFDMIKLFGSIIGMIFFTWAAFHHIKELRKQARDAKLRKLEEIDYEYYKNYGR